MLAAIIEQGPARDDEVSAGGRALMYLRRDPCQHHRIVLEANCKRAGAVERRPQDFRPDKAVIACETFIWRPDIGYAVIAVGPAREETEPVFGALRAADIAVRKGMGFRKRSGPVRASS